MTLLSGFLYGTTQVTSSMHLLYFRKLNTTVSTTNGKNREEVDAMICESVVVLDANSETPKGVASMKLTSVTKM